MAMNIGKLDRRVTIQQLTTTQDSWNHPVESWATLATVWATKQPRRAVEPTEAQQVVALGLVDWFIRYRSDVTAQLRLLDADGTAYEIVGVQEIGRREGLKLITETRA